MRMMSYPWFKLSPFGLGVSSVSIVTANGVSGSVTAGTTPAITLTLGAIRPSSIGIGAAITTSLITVTATDTNVPPSLSNTCSIELNNPSAAGGVGGQINFRNFTGPNNVFAAIGGINTDSNGSQGTIGNIIFATKSLKTDAALSTRMSVTAIGNILVGTTTEGTGMMQIVAADNGVCATLTINATQANVTGADTFVDFRSTTGSEATVVGTGAAGVIAYTTFTGAHWSQGEKDIPVNSAMISTDEICEWKGEVASHLPKSKISDKADDKAVYGVFGGYDKDGDMTILALGAGKVLVCDEGGKIKIGDFLSTSSIPGYAKKYDGDDMRVVLGKARQSFTGKKGEIACTYLCG